MNPLELFDGKTPLKRTYLPPPTSRKFVPKGMENLDQYLRKLKQNEKKAKQ